MLVIADDITGAVELAGIGWRYGLKVSLQRDLRAEAPAADLLVLDTDSRSLGAAEARQRVALAAGYARGADGVYKKADSVLRGQVRAECTELAVRLGKRAVRLCPANPSLDRTIVDGCLLIAGVPISRTGFSGDPEWPAATDRAADLLERSPGWPCLTGEAARSAAEGQIAVGDAASAADVQRWAGTLDATVLPAGGGDFFEALLQRQGYRQERRTEWVCPPSPCLMVCGSTAAASRAFVDRLEQSGREICDMPRELFTGAADDSDALERWGADLDEALARHGQAVLAIRHPVTTDGALARRLATVCARAVLQVVRHGRVRSLLVEGGATAAAIMAAMGHAQWEVVGEVQRGVGVLRPRGRELDMVLKPGSYAWPARLSPQYGSAWTTRSHRWIGNNAPRATLEEPVKQSELTRHVVVHHDPTKWAAVPANNGANGPVWQWGDELLVGFTVGTFLRAQSGHQCTYDQAFDSWLARSTDGGETWKAWKPERYAGQPADSRELAAEMNFASRGLVLRVEGNGYHGNSGCRWFASDDRGASWSGPFGFGALFEHPELAGAEFTGRTAYLVEGPREALLFLSARRTPQAGTLAVAILEKAFLARTADGGRSFSFVSWLVPWSDTSRAVMPAPIRLSPSRLVAALRRRSLTNNWIDCYASADNGATWSHLSRVGDTEAGDKHNGNPPALIAMADGRLCCVYGNRTEQRMLARFSADDGMTWSPERVVRDGFRSANGASDLGYPRLYQRPDGKLVAVYFWCTPERPETHIEATIFSPESR